MQVNRHPEGKYHMGASTQRVSVAAEVPSSSRVNLPDLYVPTKGEINARMAHFEKDWLSMSLIVDLEARGFVHRCKWTRHPHEVTQAHLNQMNRITSPHIDGEIRMNRNFIWLAVSTRGEAN